MSAVREQVKIVIASFSRMLMLIITRENCGPSHHK
jgi:hypothetical protein